MKENLIKPDIPPWGSRQLFVLTGQGVYIFQEWARGACCDTFPRRNHIVDVWQYRELALGGWSFSPWYTQNYLSSEEGSKALFFLVRINFLT